MPPQSAASQPPVIGPPPSSAPGSPPLLPQPARKTGTGRTILAFLLSLCLGLFVADGAVSLVDDSLILWLDIHVLTAVRELVFFFALLIAIVVYGLMGLTPMIPKRVFLPVTLFNPLGALAVIPLAIYFHSRLRPDRMDHLVMRGDLRLGDSLLGPGRVQVPLAAGGREPAWRPAFQLVELVCIPAGKRFRAAARRGCLSGRLRGPGRGPFQRRFPGAPTGRASRFR